MFRCGWAYAVMLTALVHSHAARAQQALSLPPSPCRDSPEVRAKYDKGDYDAALNTLPGAAWTNPASERACRTELELRRLRITVQTPLGSVPPTSGRTTTWNHGSYSVLVPPASGSGVPLQVDLKFESAPGDVNRITLSRAASPTTAVAAAWLAFPKSALDGAKVELDGNVVSPKVRDELAFLEVPVGPHRLEVKRGNQRAWILAVDVRPTEMVVTPTHSPSPGLVVARSPSAPTPPPPLIDLSKGGSIPTGRHAVVISDPNHHPWRATVVVPEEGTSDDFRIEPELNPVVKEGPAPVLQPDTTESSDWIVPSAAAISATTAGVAVVSLVGHIIASDDARDGARKHNALVDRGASPAEILSARDETSRARSLSVTLRDTAWVSGGMAVAFGAGALIYSFVAAPSAGQSQNAASSTLGLAVTPSAAAAMATIGF